MLLMLFTIEKSKNIIHFVRTIKSTVNVKDNFQNSEQ